MSTRRISSLLWMVMVFLVTVTASVRAEAGDATRVIIRLTPGLSPGDQTAVVARNGGMEVSSVAALSLHVLSIDNAQLDAVMETYRNDPQVRSVEVEKTRKAEATPADPNYALQWALSRIGWESVYGTVSPAGTATVALLDTGVDASHPDLAGKLITGTSFTAVPSTTDLNGHGTWTAGIIAAAADNGTGIAGVAYSGVQVMPVAVLDGSGTGKDGDIIAGIIWAAEHGADVILMPFSNAGFSEALQDAVDYAWSSGAVLVAATGNDGLSTPTYPAGDRSVIGVSGTDQNDLLAPGSNYGDDTFLAAPGIDILTTTPGGNYISISGTSASSAIVAGVAALMKAVDPSLSNGVIVARLAATADAAGTPDDTFNRAMFGNGRVNLANALGSSSTDSIQPAGAAPVGGGGPYVGPYVTAGNVTISGTVTDGSSPINGAIVTCTAGCAGTATTNANGVYLLNNVNYQGSRQITVTLTASANGFATGTQSFQVTNNSTHSGKDFALVRQKTDQAIIFAPASPAVYGDPSRLLTATGGGSGNPVTFAVISGPGTLNGNLLSFTGAGPIVIRASQAGNANYNDAPDIDATITVHPRPITVAADAKSKVYGRDDPELTYKLTSGSLIAGDSFSGAITRADGEAVDTYAITQGSFTAGANYILTFTPATFSITPATLTVTAAAKTKTYGEADPELTYTATGLVGSETISGALSRVSGEDVGAYAIVQGSLSASGNYALSFTPADLTISKAALSVTVQAKAKTYGETDPALTFTSTGLINGDVISGSLSRVSGEDAGTYAIVQGTLSASGNYALSFTPADLTISKAALSVTAQPKAKTYGQADPAFTFTSTGLVNGDVISGSLSRVSGEDAGTYAIIQGSLSASGNYALSFTPANLTISKAALSVTAQPKAKTYGQADPALTFTSTGLVNGDVISGSLSRVSGENVGAYAIVQGTLSAGTNYVLAYTPANFTITPAAANVTLSGLNVVYDGQPKAAGAATTPASLAVAITYNGSAVAPTNAGTYAVVATISNPNYSGTANGTLVIAKAGQTISLDTIPNKTSADAPFGLVATATSGLPVTFTASGNCTVSGSTVTITGPGSCTITASQTGNGNYTPAPNVASSFGIAAKMPLPTVVTVTGTGFSNSPVTVSWIDPANPQPMNPDLGITYLLEYSKNGGPFVAAGTTNLTSYAQVYSAGTYVFRVKSMKSGWIDSAYAQANAYPLTAATTSAPSGISTVATQYSTDPLTVSWTRSSMSGVLYQLEYSKNGGNFVVAGTTSSNSYSQVYSAGSYIFRVKAMKSGYNDSAYSSAAAPCVLIQPDAVAPGPLTVPTSQVSTQALQVSWGASQTPGVLYQLEYSKNNGPFVVAGITDSTISVPDPLRYSQVYSAGSYVFRVKAMKTGWNDSPYTVATVACILAQPDVTPATSITAPASQAATQAVRVSWGASTTSPGVLYQLEYSRNGGPFVAAGTTSSTSYTQVYSAGTYLFRVKAMKTGWNDSTYTTSSSCLLL